MLARAEPLPWPELERWRLAYRFEAGERRRMVALELERELRDPDAQQHLLGSLQERLLELGPRDSFEQLERFFPWALRHQAGPHAGQPFYLAEMQRDFLREFWRRDRHGERVYTTGLFGAPKGNGKTPLIAGLGLHTLVAETDAPEVYDLAGARDQADIAHEFARESIDGGPLAAWLEVGSSIRCDEHNGELEVLSAAGDLGHGTKPSAAFFDEKWLYRHREQREAVNAQEKALHKRPGRAFACAFSAAGWTKHSLLGEEYDALVNHPQLEERDDGFLLVLRDEEAGYLGWWHGLPPDFDGSIDDPDVVRRANPAPWVRPSDLLRALRKPGQSESDWIRLHLNGWTSAQETWLPSGVWAGLRSDARIPDGAGVYVAVDAAHSYDTTAVAWAAQLEDGRIAVRVRVWSARKEAPHHKGCLAPGGTIDNEQAFRFIADELAHKFRVCEVVADPRFFDVFLRWLDRAGFTVAEFAQNSGAMRDAEQHFYEAAHAGRITHNGDRVLAAHVAAAVAVKTQSGFRVDNVRNAEPVDALTAVMMARERCARAGDVPARAEPWAAVW